MRLRKKIQLLLLSLIWFGTGLFLLAKGVDFTFMINSDSFSPLHYALVSTGLHPLQVGLLRIIVGIFLGRFKAQKILSKVIERVKNNLDAYKDPAPLSATFNVRFFVLIALMMGLGAALNALQFPLDLRALLNAAVGSALIFGSVMVFTRKQSAEALT
jgi:hypothetical protein